MIVDQELFLQTGYIHTLDNPIVIHWPKTNPSYYRKGPSQSIDQNWFSTLNIWNELLQTRSSQSIDQNWFHALNTKVITDLKAGVLVKSTVWDCFHNLDMIHFKDTLFLLKVCRYRA